MEEANSSATAIDPERRGVREHLASVSIHQHALVEPGARIGPGTVFRRSHTFCPARS